MQLRSNGHQYGPLTSAEAAAAARGSLSDHSLRGAFVEILQCRADRGGVLIAADEPAPTAILIDRGAAFRALTNSDGRRVIIDLLLPGDIAGSGDALTGSARGELVAANSVSYRALAAASLQALIADPLVALGIVRSMSEAQRRADRHLFSLARLDARERIAAFLVEIYDRLQQRNLISRETFVLPLTQEQMADYLGITMVHVSRTLKRLYDEKLVLINRQVVILLDVLELRAVADANPGRLPPLTAVIA